MTLVPLGANVCSRMFGNVSKFPLSLKLAKLVTVCALASPGSSAMAARTDGRWIWDFFIRR